MSEVIDYLELPNDKYNSVTINLYVEGARIPIREQFCVESNIRRVVHFLPPTEFSRLLRFVSVKVQYNEPEFNTCVVDDMQRTLLR